MLKFRVLLLVGLFAWLAGLPVTGSAQTYPFWGEPVELRPVDPKNKLLGDYLRARDALSCTNANQTCLAFYANRLEDKIRWISDDAFQYVSVQPINVVRENVDSFPLPKLRRFAVDPNVDPVRRDFYAMVLGIKKHPADRTLLLDLFDEYLAKESLRQVSMVGIMVGYALSGSKFTAPMLVKAVRYNYSAAKDQQELHADNVLTALEFLKDDFPGTVDTVVGPVLKAAMQRDSQMRERALSLAQRWGDPALATLVWEQLKKGNTSASYQQSAKAYCGAVQEEACHLVLVWFQDQETLQSIPRLANDPAVIGTGGTGSATPSPTATTVVTTTETPIATPTPTPPAPMVP